jgi:hypothetical protein
MNDKSTAFFTGTYGLIFASNSSTTVNFRENTVSEYIQIAMCETTAIDQHRTSA